jgi:hypothetical protein
MDSDTPAPTGLPCALSPLSAPTCPLCGQPNACAPARTGAFSQPCWCQSASFSPELLARVPEHLRNVACICQACASSSV